MKSPILLALAMLSSAFTITPVIAAEPGAVTSIVRTADLDLSTNAGRRALDKRIVRAAFEVCGEASTADLEGRNDVRQCRAETVAQAASQRDQLLAAAKNGSPIVFAARR